MTNRIVCISPYSFTTLPQVDLLSEATIPPKEKGFSTRELGYLIDSRLLFYTFLLTSFINSGTHSLPANKHRLINDSTSSANYDWVYPWTIPDNGLSSSVYHTILVLQHYWPSDFLLNELLDLSPASQRIRCLRIHQSRCSLITVSIHVCLCIAYALRPEVH